MAMQLVGQERRKLRIRRKLSGTAARPRVTVFRSLKHIYAQAIDDVGGVTLAQGADFHKHVASMYEVHWAQLRAIMYINGARILPHKTISESITEPKIVM